MRDRDILIISYLAEFTKTICGVENNWNAYNMNPFIHKIMMIGTITRKEIDNITHSKNHKYLDLFVRVYINKYEEVFRATKLNG